MTQSLVQQFALIYQKLELRNQPIVLAFSGGVDSSVLVDLCQRVAPQQPLTLAYFNHLLRSDSDQEEEHVRTFAQAHQLPLVVGHWQDQPKRVNEATARNARYHFLKQVLQQQTSTILLTAHHGDDLLETVLLNLVRSGGLNELPGLQLRRPFHQHAQLVRPLLTFSKAQLRAYADEKHLDYIEDQTNYSDFTARNRLRHQVVPLLKDENPQVIAHVNRFSHELDSLKILAQQQLQTLLKQAAIKKETHKFIGQLPQTTLSLTAWQLFWQLFWQTYLPDYPLPSQGLLRQLAQLSQKPHGHHELDLGHRWQFKQTYRNFVIELMAVKAPSSDAKSSAWFNVMFNQVLKIGYQRFAVLAGTIDEALEKKALPIALDHWPTSLKLRHGQSGDMIQLANGQHQPLRRYLINHKVPYAQREKLWLLEADGQIIWLENYYHYKLFNDKETAKIIYVLWSN